MAQNHAFFHAFFHAFLNGFDDRFRPYQRLPARPSRRGRAQAVHSEGYRRQNQHQRPLGQCAAPFLQTFKSPNIQIASRPVPLDLLPAINVTHPKNLTVLQPLIFLSSTPKVLLSALTWPAQYVTAYVESHPERRWLTQSVADDMMLKSYKGRRNPQPLLSLLFSSSGPAPARSRSSRER